MRNKLLISLYALMLLPLSIFAGKNGYQFWGEAIVTGDIPGSENLLYLFDVEPRLNISDTAGNQTVYTAAFGYKINSKLSAWQGYDLQINYPRNSVNTLVVQIPWQQLTYNFFSNSALNLSSNSRLEERFLNANDQINFRYRQRLTIQGNHKIFGYLNPVAFDEVFFNLNNPAWAGNRLIPENRAFLGLLLPIGKSQSLRLGYMDILLFNETTTNVNVAYLTYQIRT